MSKFGYAGGICNVLVTRVVPPILVTIGWGLETEASVTL